MTIDRFKIAMLLGITLALTCRAQDFPVVPKLAAPAKLDGSLSDSCWQSALSLKLEQRVEGSKTPLKPVSPCDVRVFSDDANLYFGFTCKSDGSGPYVRDAKNGAKKLSMSEQVMGSDYVCVLIDPGRWGFYDYYLIYADASGRIYVTTSWYQAATQRDMDAKTLGIEGGAVNDKDSKHWSVVLKVPFAMLLRHPGDGMLKTLGLNFRHVQWGEDAGKVKVEREWNDTIDRDKPSREHFMHMSLWHNIPCYKTWFASDGDYWANEAVLDEFGLVEVQAGKLDNKPVKGYIEGGTGNGIRWPVYTNYTESFSDYKDMPRMARMDDIRAKDGWTTGEAKIKSQKAPADGPVNFTQKPEVARSGSEAVIRFAVNRETDVCVNIIDDKGHAIRHLASGELGASAPAPLKPGSLAQEIHWDLKDDDGKTVTGSYHARVGLCLSPTFARTIPINLNSKLKKDDPAMWGNETHLQVETMVPAALSGGPIPTPHKVVDETHGGGAKNLVALDVARNELYLPGYEVYDATSGKLLRKFAPARSAQRYADLEGGQELAFGKDGMIYTTGFTGICRLDTKGNPLPFESTGRFNWPTHYLAHSNPHRGHCVGPNGDIYVIHHFIGHGNFDCQISEVAPDGRMKRYGFIELRGISASSLAVDHAGCVYVGVTVNPKDHAVPEELSKLPADIKWAYELSYGSVVKFPPGGGTIAWDDSASEIVGDRHCGGHKEYGCKLDGAEWIHPGMSPVLTRARAPEPVCCVCRQSRFALDPSGRLFVPDAIMGRVQVIDAAGNTLRYIGARGTNAEKLQFRWPENILANDDYCYVCDYMHMQCIQIKLSYQASEEVAIAR